MALPQINAPVAHRYFEDYLPGHGGEYGPVTLTEAEIIEFAAKYDPQFLHTDPEAAASGPFGGLIASGWHTIGVVMRILVEQYLSHVASMASPGIDELRWLKPVRPGDSLTVRLEVLEANRSRSKPDRGIVKSRIEAVNQHGETVLRMQGMNVIRCRSAPPPGE